MIVWIAEGPLAALHEPRSIASYQSLDGRHAVVVFAVAAPWPTGHGAAPWPAEHLGDPLPSVLPALGALVVAQRQYEGPVARHELSHRRWAAAACLDLYSVRPIASCVALDGRRQVCWFEAPDAESVRTVARTTHDPYRNIWTVQYISAGGRATKGAPTAAIQ